MASEASINRSIIAVDVVRGHADRKELVRMQQPKVGGAGGFQTILSLALQQVVASRLRISTTGFEQAERRLPCQARGILHYFWRPFKMVRSSEFDDMWSRLRIASD